MRKIYILLVSFLSINTINAQITLTNTNNNPTLGYSFTNHDFDATTFNIGAAGANVIWDYSSIVSQSNDLIEHITPSTLSDAANHPAANIAVSAPNSQGYLVVDNDEYSVAGIFINGLARDMYTDVREFYKFPITFGNIFNETFAGTQVNFTSQQTFNRGGLITIEADAYGTLIMPYGTINNVLRLKTTTNYADTFLGVPFIIYDEVLYSWFNANTMQPILTYTEFTALGNTSFIGRYSDFSNVVTGINDFIQKPSIKLFPNPAIDQVTITLDEVIDQGNIQIVDISGKIVKRTSIGLGSKNIQVQLEGIDKGIYFVQITDLEKVIVTEKLIIN